jgi:hypothetical protein
MTYAISWMRGAGPRYTGSPDRECTVATRLEVIEASIAAFADGRLSEPFIRSMARTVERDLVDWEERVLPHRAERSAPEPVDEESQ